MNRFHAFWKNRQSRRQTAPESTHDIDSVLLYLSPQDPWTLRDACEGVQVFGGIGSGKTSGSGATLAKVYLRNGFGGLVLCAKPEERELWEQYAAENGRSDDLIIVSPEADWRFNLLDYEYQRTSRGGGLTENIVTLIANIADIVEGRQAQETGDQFWNRAMKELVRNAVTIITLAQDSLSLEDIKQLVLDAPTDSLQIGNEVWQNTSFCAACIQLANDAPKTRRQAHDCQMAMNYWLKSFPNLGERTRSSIVATFTSLADMLLTGMAWEILCTETNLVPEMTYENGRIIVLDFPIQEFQMVGKLIQNIFKTMFQQAILRRNPHTHPRPVFLWADEAQNFVSDLDYQFQSVARSARACTVYLTQNISNYYAVMGTQGRDRANALLGNFSTKIFHANNGDTNQYAADIIAQKRTLHYNYNASKAEQGHSHSAGGSDALEYKVLPATFTTLRKGGTPNKLQVEAIVFQSGRVFNASGETYLKAIFRQG